MKFMKQPQCIENQKQPYLLNKDRNIYEEVPHDSQKTSIPFQITQMDIETVEIHKNDEEQYLQEIVTYLTRLTDKLAVQSDYFKNQPDITEHMRQILLGWLIDAHLKYKLQPQTLFIAVHILDTCLSLVPISRSKLQLLGITALWIASKYQETYQIPKIDNLVYICNSTYTKQDILSMESCIFQLLNFNILLNTELHYFNIINHISHFQTKDYFLCQYILEMCLFGLHFKKFTSKLMACSVAYFVRKLKKHEIFWSNKQQQLFNVFEDQIKQCVKDIYIFWQYSEQIQALQTLRNKFKSTHYNQVAKIKIYQINKKKSIETIAI